MNRAPKKYIAIGLVITPTISPSFVDEASLGEAANRLRKILGRMTDPKIMSKNEQGKSKLPTRAWKAEKKTIR